MKKIVLVTLAVLALASGLSFFMNAKIDEETPGGEFRSKVVLGFAQLGAESEWRTSSSQSVIDAAREYGIELMFENAQQKQENQIKAIRSFIAHRVDVIAFSPVVETGWDNVLLEARAAGIPVILVDRRIETELSGVYVSYLGSDFAEEGRRAGRWLMQKFRGTEGGIGIVELRGTEGASPTKGRDEGFREEISGDGRFAIVRSLSGDFMRSKGRETMEHILDEYYNPAEGRNIDVLFAHNDDMAMGAMEEMEKRGIRPGRDVVIISVDAQRSALEALREGRINCVVECTPYVGERLMRLVMALASGETVPQAIYSDETVFTEDDPPESLPARSY
ncbi:MAG: ABC transporter substrate-binding protein [Synergistaceae bacterium]|jgi:simple sugar transport system substrate-binding protein|nr:ABC transporter substrate-binding protein [Synergistaceae bacterium]